MPGRFGSGSANPQSGPRLPRPKGPFCAICQGEDRPNNHVHVGVWGVIHFHMDLPLCDECIDFWRPRLDPDPLTIEEAA